MMVYTFAKIITKIRLGVRYLTCAVKCLNLSNSKLGDIGRIAHEYRVEMSRALYDSYVEILSSGECRTQYEAVERARRSTAPSYYTSARNCNYILSRMYAGEPTGLRDREKIRKFEALYDAAERYRAEHDEWPGLFNVCREIVEEEAPEYFICHNSAKQMILHERKKRREEIARKWARQGI